MDDSEFRGQRLKNVRGMANDTNFSQLSSDWFNASVEHRYSYNFDWLGLPVIQYPQDTVFLQELLWSVKPDLVIETGVARGGSLTLSASMMVLLQIERDEPLEFVHGKSMPRVVGVEIALSEENRKAISGHFLSPLIELVDGSSTAFQALDRVKAIISEVSSANPIVILDSNHSHDHVLSELNQYSKFVQVGGFVVVMDTVIENLDASLHDPNRWGKGDNPMSAVSEFLLDHHNFVVDETFTEKLMLSVAPKGVLRRIF